MLFVYLKHKLTHELFSFSVGFTGGMFLKRSRVKKPGQEVFKSEPSVYIKSEELYVGVTVNVNGYLFKLLNADEFTLKYMEKNSDRVNLLCIILTCLPTFCNVCFSLGPFFCSSCHWFYIVHSHVGMNNGFVQLGHRSHHRGQVLVYSVYMLDSPLLSITDSRHRQEAGSELNQVSWVFC